MLGLKGSAHIQVNASNPFIKWVGSEYTGIPFYNLRRQLTTILGMTRQTNPERTQSKWVQGLGLNVFET